MAKVTTPLQFARDETVNGETHTIQVAVQSVLDQMLPYMLPLAFVGLAYFLMRRYHLSAVWVLVILAALAFGLAAIGAL